MKVPGFESRKRQEICLHKNVHTVTAAQPPYYLMSTWGSFPKVKWQRREGGHLPPPRAEVKNVLCCIHTASYSLHGTIRTINCCVTSKSTLGVEIHTNTKTHTHTYTYIHIYVHIYTHIHAYIRTYIHINTYILAYIHAYIHMYIHTYIHTYSYIHTYINKYTHTYICTYVHIYSYIHTYKQT